MATGVCSAFSLNASDRPRLKNDMVLKQWKSRPAGTMCCFNCRAGGRSEGRTTKSRTFLLRSDRWMLPLAIHLALVKHSQRQIGEGGKECSCFRASVKSVPILSSSFFPFLCFHLSVTLSICPTDGIYVLLQFQTKLLPTLINPIGSP